MIWPTDVSYTCDTCMVTYLSSNFQRCEFVAFLAKFRRAVGLPVLAGTVPVGRFPVPVPDALSKELGSFT